MLDLLDGQTARSKVPREPYILKNVGGVYSCNCPSWRNQSLPIEQRTCKHLKKYRGDQAEQQRIGQAPDEVRPSSRLPRKRSKSRNCSWPKTGTTAPIQPAGG